ncbi:MAG: glycoside hydrolase domain-containing protein [Chloroflexota bacterium]
MAKYISSYPIRRILPLITIILLGLVSSGWGPMSGVSATASESPQLQIVNPGIQEFEVISENHGWLLFNYRLFWTDDNGRNWREITPAYAAQATIGAVKFIDPQRGWAILTITDGSPMSYILARTVNGGVNWQYTPLALFQQGDVDALAGEIYLEWFDASTGWLVIKKSTSSNFSLGSLFRTTDGGSTWTRGSAPIGEPVYFVTRDIGWMAGGAAGDELYRSIDGGRTWQPQTVQPSPEGAGRLVNYLLPQFGDSNTGTLPVLVNDGYNAQLSLYATSDGGASWQLTSGLAITRNVDVGAGLPLAVFDRGRMVMVMPQSYQIASMSGDGRISLTNNQDHRSLGIVELEMASLTSGWAKHMTGDCHPDPNLADNDPSEPKGDVTCTLTVQLLTTTDGGVNWTPVTLPVIRATSYSRQVTTWDTSVQESIPGSIPNLGPRTEIFIGHGFDKCEISNLSQMQVWWNESPYAAVNLYIGGSARACANSLLNSTFVSQLNQQGWKFIPTWVGPQAPCTSYRSRISADPTVAYNQGISEANAALVVAANLGLTDSNGAGTIIYYDLEAYNTTDTACRNAVKSFISGWDARMAATNNLSGVYGSPCSSALSDFLTIPVVPDGIWIARWSYTTFTSTATVWGGACLSDTAWPNHQRIRQYTGGHNETWGGILMNVDSNVLDGIVAVPHDIVSSAPPTIPNGPKPSDGALLPRTNDTYLYWTTNATSCTVRVWGGNVDINQTGGCYSLYLGQRAGGAYSWQITATNSNGTVTGPVWRFNIRPHPPSNLGGTVTSATQVTLNWTLSSDEPNNIDLYDVYMNNQLLGSVSKGTSAVVVSGLACNTSNSFFLRANRQGVQSTNTNIINLTQTGPCIPAPFGKILPANGASDVSTNPTMTWEASSGALSYQYCIDTSDNNTCDTAWTSTATNTNVGLSGLISGTTYYWQVKAINTLGETIANGGTWWRFTPVTNPPTSTPTRTATASPTLGTQTATPTPTQTGTFSLTTTATPTATPSVPGPSATSTPTQTSTPTPVPPTPTGSGLPGAFNKLDPPNGSTNAPTSPTLSWGSSSGASLYIYCYDTINNNNCDGFWRITTSNSAPVSGLTAGTTYYWQVQAVNSSGATFADTGTWWNFRPTNTPVLPSPTPTRTSTATTTSPGTTATHTPTRTATATLTRTSTATLPPPVLTTTSTPTRTSTPTTAPPTPTGGGSPGAFNKIDPPNGSTSAPTSLTLSWGSSAGASLYIYCYDTINNNNCDGFWRITYSSSAPVSGLVTGTTYYWQVQAVNSFGATFADIGTWWSFRPGTGPIATTPPPVNTHTPTRTPTSTATMILPGPSPTPTSTWTSTPLVPTPPPGAVPGPFNKLSPSNGASGLSTSLTLSWGSSAGATIYIYCYDITNNNNCEGFWKIVDTTSVNISGLTPGVNYYWQVQAINSSGATFADADAWWSFRP